MSDAANQASLAILRCPGCNAPVPLGGGDDVVCRYCEETFPVPDAYRALRDAERQRAEERDEARALYGTLGRPPGVVARMWGEIAIGCVWLVVWPIAFVADGLLIAKGLEIASRSMHVTLYEVLPNTLVWGGIGAALYMTLAVPLALGIYGKRRTNGRRRLQAALAALPPDREGGPVRCHTCGAPLDVGPKDLGLACLYCGADNLVRMPEAWVANLRTTVGKLGTEIESAGREDRELRARERKSLRRQLAWPLVFIPVMVAFGVAFDRDTEAYPPNWRHAMAGARRMLPAAVRTGDSSTDFIPPPIPVDGATIRLAFDESERRKDYCIRSYVLALRYGERVTFTAGDFPAGARGLGFTFRTQESAIFGDDWEPVGNNVILFPNDSATFDAPRSAWYRVDVLMVDDVPPGEQFELAVSVAPAT